MFNTILNEPLFDNSPCMDKFYEFHFCTLNIIKKDLHFAKNEKLNSLAGKNLVSWVCFFGDDTLTYYTSNQINAYILSIPRSFSTGNIRNTTKDNPTR